MACATRRKPHPLSRTPLGEPGRLSPPIWPCTTRGLPCLRCCHRSGGLLLHLFTLARRNKHFEDVSEVYLRDATVLLRRRSIFCGTFREPPSRHEANLASSESLPRRYLARRPYSSPALASLRRGCPDFPPVRPSCDSQTDDHPAHPPFLLYPRTACRVAEFVGSEPISFRPASRIRPPSAPALPTLSPCHTSI